MPKLYAFFFVIFASFSFCGETELRIHWGFEHLLFSERHLQAKYPEMAPIELTIFNGYGGVIAMHPAVTPYSNQGDGQPPWPDPGFFDRKFVLDSGREVRIVASTVIHNHRIELFDISARTLEGFHVVSVADKIVMLSLQPVETGGIYSESEGAFDLDPPHLVDFGFLVEKGREPFSIPASWSASIDSKSILPSVHDREQLRFSALLPVGSTFEVGHRSKHDFGQKFGPFDQAGGVYQIKNGRVSLDRPRKLFYLFEPPPEGVSPIGSVESQGGIAPFFSLSGYPSLHYRAAIPVLRSPEEDMMNRDLFSVERLASAPEGGISLFYGGLPEVKIPTNHHHHILVPFTLLHVKHDRFTLEGEKPIGFTVTHSEYPELDPLVASKRKNLINGDQIMIDPELSRFSEIKERSHFLADEGIYVPPGEYSLQAMYPGGKTSRFEVETYKMRRVPRSGCDFATKYLANIDHHAPAFSEVLSKYSDELSIESRKRGKQ